MTATAATATAARGATLDERLRALYAADPALLANPYDLYDELRETAPVHWFGSSLVIVSSYQEARSVYRDSDRFLKYRPEVSHFDGADELLSEGDRRLLREVTEFERLYMSSMNGSTHARVRGAVQSAFSPRRIGVLGEVAQRQTDLLLERLAQQEEPDVIELAQRVPLLVIMELIGAPLADAELLKRWGDDINDHKGRRPIEPAVVRRAHASLREFRAYVRALIEDPSPRPASLLAGLREARQNDSLSHEELEATMVLLLFAGHETTSNLIGNGLYALLTHRDQWARLCAEPRLAKAAVEELLRYDPPVQAMRSVTACAVELGGVEIPAGTGVLMLNAAANRDPSVFARPHALELTRSPNPHLTFGFGSHFCLGAPLARLEGRVVFETLARRFPAIEIVAAPDAVERNGHPQLRGLRRLRVTLGADHVRS
jgi:cytochrome P450